MILKSQSRHWPLARFVGVALLALSACTAPTAVPTSQPVDTAEQASTVAPTTVAATADLDVTPAPTAFQQTPAPATSIKVERPSGLAFDGEGNLLISACADGPPQLYRLDQYELLSVFASPTFGGFGGDGGPALAAHIAC